MSWLPTLHALMPRLLAATEAQHCIDTRSSVLARPSATAV